jgi:hypothetical protein
MTGPHRDTRQLVDVICYILKDCLMRSFLWAFVGVSVNSRGLLSQYEVVVDSVSFILMEQKRREAVVC